MRVLNGKMYISLTAKDAGDAAAAGVLAYIEIEALMPGRPAIAFDRDVLNFLTVDGKKLLENFLKETTSPIFCAASARLWTRAFDRRPSLAALPTTSVACASRRLISVIDDDNSSAAEATV